MITGIWFACLLNNFTHPLNFKHILFFFQLPDLQIFVWNLLNVVGCLTLTWKNYIYSNDSNESNESNDRQWTKSDN